jgi:solute:Na+ symporter, SSS family
MIVRLTTRFTLAIGLLLTARAFPASLDWSELPPLPDPMGVAGPVVGVHNDALIIGGGANFPGEPLWTTDKVWHDAIYVMTRTDDGYAWHDGGVLPSPRAYVAAVSTSRGVVCMGGNDRQQVFDDVLLLSWDPEKNELTQSPLPSLPRPCAFGSATMIGDVIYLAGGTTGADLETAMNNFWSLDLSKANEPDAFQWREMPPWPGPERAFNITVAQHDGFNDGIYVISGRRQDGDSVAFLTDVYEYIPAAGKWRTRADTPQSFMAGTGLGYGQSHIFVLGGADGTLWGQADALKDNHPGFPKEAFAYHTITDTWSSAGTTPANHVTTVPVMWNSRMIIASGEVRPRVRSPKIWAVAPEPAARTFGALNYGVLVVYLGAMVGVGLYFARRNKDTDDYFRGGKRMAWWAAGCSIFATMLSSLTYTGVPSKAYAQDWVYIVGNFMILGVAPIAVYVALPFFRKIDATSAYEYLEKRFNRAVRLFGSASFTLFHIFRMAVVMSLTGLALAAATPISPAYCVLIMGILSIVYCTMGGVEAVIWTDTIQTFVLLGGALAAFAFLIAGVDGGFSGFIEAGSAHGKFHMVNVDFSADSFTRMAIWVVIIGSFGQNLSSYTADQAVVQRYMTTPDTRRAALSIWTNALLSMAASFLFFGLGTALFAFYRSHPLDLDPTITTDQVFPLFIATELPAGLAGLIVAGIFAAAQSTVSTSMNSISTTVITDFARPMHLCRSEAGYLRVARGLTLLVGCLGTLVALVFLNPDIKSMLDTFIKVIGLFMGVLGGLFALGVLTRRAHGGGALVGAIVGAAAMFHLWKNTQVNGYLYTFIGIAVCFAVGYAVSLVLPRSERDLTDLTLYTIERSQS